MQYSQNKDHWHLKWRQQKFCISFPDCQVVQDKQQRCSISLYPSQNGRCSQIFENSEIGVSRHLDSSTTTQMAKIMVQYGRPSCSSWAESVLSSFGRTIMGKAVWENPIEVRWVKGFQLWMSHCTSWKGLFLSVNVDDRKIGCKETNHWSDVETTQQRSRIGTTNMFLGSCILGLHSKTMWNKQKYCGQSQEPCSIREFLRGDQRNYHSLKIFVFLHGLMIWLVMQRSVWNDIVS